MSGELWRGYAALGKEDPAGTAVAATRRVYLRDLAPSGTGAERRFHRFATGTRDNQRAVTQGPKRPGGQAVFPLSPSEIVEWLLLGIKGGVTPTQPDALNSPTVYLWTFKPGETLDSATLEVHDGARSWREVGVQVNQLRIAGNVREENLVTCELFGLDFEANAMTGGLTERVPDFAEGWETKVYIDPFGAAPGSTLVSDFLINWDITINNQMGRKKFANNTRQMDRNSMGELQIQATFLVEGVEAQALTEFDNAEGDSPTKRVVRLEFGNNLIAEDELKQFVTIDIPGAWRVVDLTQSDEGTRAYEFSYDYLYDPTLTYGLQVRCQNTRATAW